MVITLKKRHLLFIASILKNVVASRFFKLLMNIKDAVDGHQDDDNVSVGADVADVKEIFQLLGGLPERQTAKINREMNSQLESQIAAGVQAQDAEWIDLYEFSINTAEETANWVNSQVESGKYFLTN